MRAHRALRREVKGGTGGIGQLKRCQTAGRLGPGEGLTQGMKAVQVAGPVRGVGRIAAKCVVDLEAVADPCREGRQTCECRKGRVHWLGAAAEGPDTGSTGFLESFKGWLGVADPEVGVACLSVGQETLQLAHGSADLSRRVGRRGVVLAHRAFTGTSVPREEKAVEKAGRGGVSAGCPACGGEADPVMHHVLPAGRGGDLGHGQDRRRRVPATLGVRTGEGRIEVAVQHCHGDRHIRIGRNERAEKKLTPDGRVLAEETKRLGFEPAFRGDGAEEDALARPRRRVGHGPNTIRQGVRQKGEGIEDPQRRAETGVVDDEGVRMSVSAHWTGHDEVERLRPWLRADRQPRGRGSDGRKLGIGTDTHHDVGLISDDGRIGGSDR